jgi:hypothetical protein
MGDMAAGVAVVGAAATVVDMEEVVAAAADMARVITAAAIVQETRATAITRAAMSILPNANLLDTSKFSTL